MRATPSCFQCLTLTVDSLLDVLLVRGVNVVVHLRRLEVRLPESLRRRLEDGVPDGRL